jgi:PAS domain S-box-containing protein
LISPAWADSGDGLPPQGSSWRRRYAVALGCVTLALLARLALDPAVPPSPLVLLLASVIVSAWYGGAGPALLATLLSAVLGGFLLLPLAPSFVKGEWGAYLPVAEFLLAGAFVSWLAGRLRASRRRCEQSQGLLSLLIDGAKDHAIFLLDPQGQVSSWNAGAERIQGYSSREIIDRHFSCFYPEEEVRAGRPEAHLRAAAAHGRLEAEGWRRRKDGSLFWAGVVLTALRDESRRLRGFSTIVRDRTDIKRAQDAQRGSEEQARRILDSLPAHVALLDGDGNVLQVNSAWERFARANGDPAFARSGVGSNYLDVCERAAKQGDALALQVRDGLSRLLEGSLREFSIEYPCHSPTEQRWFLLHARPLCRERGVVCSHLPITELKRAEEDLRQSEERLRLAMEVTGMGMWCTQEGRPDSTDWSARLKELWGLPADVEMTVDRIWSLIHPDDREMVRQVVDRALDPAGAGRFVVEHRVLLPDGATRWVQDRGQTKFEGPAGARRPTRSIGTVLDVTERKRADQAARETQAQLQLMADSLPVLISYIDADRRYQFNNAAYEDWFGLAKEAYKGRHMREVIGDAAYEALRGHVEAALAGAPRSFETRVPYRAAGTRDVHIEYVPHRDGDGRVLGFVALIMDISDRRLAEESLRQSEERFRKIFENAATGIAITDWQWRFQQCNPAYSALLGYSEQELHRIDFASLVHPEDREANLAEIRRLQTGEVPSFEIENRYVHRDGRPVWVRKFVSVLPDATGKPAHLLALVTDITERKRAGAALRESEEKMRLFIEHAPVALAMFDRQMRYLAVSRRWRADYRLGDEEITGRSHYEVFPEIPEHWREVHRRGLGGEVVRADEDFFPRVDGSVQWLRWEVRPWRQADGTVGGIIIFTEDISARKRADEALRQSEERFRLMADRAPVMIWVSGTDRLCTWFNQPWLDFVGRALEQELGNGWSENVHPGDFDQCHQTYAAAFDARQSFTMEYRLKRHDGEYRWVLDSGIPLYGAGGEFTGYIGSCVDITDRKRDEEKLRQLTADLRARVEELTTLLDILPGGVMIADPHCRRLTGNRALNEMLGVPQGANVSLTAEQPDLPAGVRVFRDGRELSADEFPMQVTGLTGRRFKDFDHDLVFPDGRVVTLLANTAPLLDEYGTIRGVVGAYMDISDRKRAEERLRASEARMQAILNTAADAIITIDYRGIIQSVNPVTERMFGYAAGEMVGQNITMLMPSPYREEHTRYLDRYLRTGVRSIIGIGREVRARRKDGTTFAADLAVSDMAPLRLFTGILRDISPRKQLEREVLEIAAEEQRRIGQELHDGVGQELTGLSLMADTLVERLETTSPTEVELAAKVLDGLGRVHGQVRALSRGLVPVEVDPEGLRAALQELAARTEDQSGVRCELECVGPVDVADSVMATNLFRIAQEAVSNALRHGHPRNIQIALHGEPGTLSLSVQDDGAGLASDSVQGKGLGIRLMRYRAGRVGGTLVVGPAAGGGTAVRCVVPRARGDHHERSDQSGEAGQGFHCR